MNILNELRKSDKMRGLPCILSIFCNEYDIFNNTRARARMLSPISVTIPATIHHDLSQMVNSGCVGMEKRKSSINTVSRDNPTVSARFIYGSTFILLRLMTAALRFTTVELRMLTMTPRFDTVLHVVRFKPVALR